ncbi:DMT family transporter [Comamonas sp. NLF-1-9]|uniref:DMT family transporter n=1 Tax=Comamonas sp. NLF-1-9 TaxID=2853163 RepID=UPI001C454EF9|nr:DMT family transporter [Comamonas sp. NLF-1-9]QXL85000.1 DMT family transporter [Comamonas sp. NLF-1-9]
MSPSRRAQLAVALIFVVPLLWGFNFLIARSAPGVIAPNTLAAERWLLAGLAFGAVAWRELWQHRRAVLADWRHMLVLGALGMWICGAWVYLAGQSTNATNMALIYAISPVMIALISRLWLKEAFGARQALGVALALAGVVHVVLRGQWGALAQLQWAAGDLWMVGAMLAWAFFTILLKRWRSPLSDMGRLAVMSAWGVLVMLPLLAWEAASGPLPLLSWQGAGLVLAAAALPGFGAYLCYTFMVRELGAARAGAVLYLNPPYAALMAWAILGEPIHGYHLVGLLLILPGIWLVNRR